MSFRAEALAAAARWVAFRIAGAEAVGEPCTAGVALADPLNERPRPERSVIAR